MKYREALRMMDDLQAQCPLADSELFALVNAETGIPCNTLRIIWEHSRD